MKLGRLVKLGNAWAVVVPVRIRRELQWFPGDEIRLDIHDGGVLLRNATQHDVQPILVPRGKFEERHSRTERAV